MKDCTYFEGQISLYLDDMLTQEETDELLAHLEQCPVCRALYEDLRNISGALRQTEVSPPEGFSKDVLAAVGAEKTRKRSAYRTWASIAAALLIGLLSVGTVGHLLHSSGNIQEAAARYGGSGPGEVLAEGAGGNEPAAEESAEAVEKQGEGERVTGGAQAEKDYTAAENQAAEDCAAAENGTVGTTALECFAYCTDDGANPAEASPTEKPALYFAVLTVEGQGAETTLNREELDAFLEKLDAAGVFYTLQTEGTEIRADAAYCLVCYTGP